MRNILAKENTIDRYIKRAVEVMNNQRGDGGGNALGIIIAIAIAILVGGVLLGLLNVAIPDLFNSMINKIKSNFSL
ncbi:hypothetical protein DFR58_1298 [Anaerobacterium chartisolvens]|uniref:Uncharacterized protein n=1 Tax=Anaerobacterium chartisolvens TaxID=1297424 RepID=A0A369AQB7_9FIRM|nr:hypothetical protein [Anaerobacterium chartisolvens]RCX10416.1 hypothetical protein DFR58_1298 [Anaerobacterium chartisolvens]